MDLAGGRVSCNLVWALGKWWMRLESFLIHLWMKKWKCDWGEHKHWLSQFQSCTQSSGKLNTHSSFQEVNSEIEFCVSLWANPNPFLLRRNSVALQVIAAPANLSAMRLFWKVSCQSLSQFSSDSAESVQVQNPALRDGGYVLLTGSLQLFSEITICDKGEWTMSTKTIWSM